MKRADYGRGALTEDEVLNVVCDARANEATHPLEKLRRKYKHQSGDKVEPVGRPQSAVYRDST